MTALWTALLIFGVACSITGWLLEVHDLAESRRRVFHDPI